MQRSRMSRCSTGSQWKEGSIIIIHHQKPGQTQRTLTCHQKTRTGVLTCAPGGNNWSKAPRKSRTDDAQASARGITTPSATSAGWGNQQTPLRSGSPHHTSRGCREGGDVERVVVRIPESRPAETMDRERRTNFAPRYGKNGNGRDRGHGLDKE